MPKFMRQRRYRGGVLVVSGLFTRNFGCRGEHPGLCVGRAEVRQPMPFLHYLGTMHGQSVVLVPLVRLRRHSEGALLVLLR